MATGAKGPLGSAEAEGGVDIVTGPALHFAVKQLDVAEGGGVAKVSPLAGKRSAVIYGNRMAPAEVDGERSFGFFSEADGLIAAYGPVVATKADFRGVDRLAEFRVLAPLRILASDVRVPEREDRRVVLPNMTKTAVPVKFPFYCRGSGESIAAIYNSSD